MRIFLSVITVVALVVSLGSVIVAQDVSTDEEAIRKMDAVWSEAWNNRDAETIIAMYAEDADGIDAMGRTVDGRTAILEHMTEQFEMLPEGVTAQSEQTHLRFLRPNIAIADGTWAMSGMAEGMPAQGLYTVVYMKQDGEWKVVAGRSRIPVASPSAEEE